MENEPKLSKIFIKKYEKIKILGEGNYGKAILVKSLTDNVNKYIYNIIFNIIVTSSNKIDRFIQINRGTKKRCTFRR